jgi:hypothetical protein
MRRLRLVSGVLIAIVLMLLVAPMAGYTAPSVEITSPTSNTSQTDSSLLVTGTASANTSIKVLVDGVQQGFTQSDGSGSWQVQLTNLAQGSHTITAQAIAGDFKGLFTTINLGSGTAQLNTIDQNDNSLNSGAGWPVSLGSNIPLVVTLSPDNSTAYITNSSAIPGGNYVAKIDVSAPGSPQIVAGYPAASTPSNAAFNLDGTKAIIANLDGTVSFIDVASNTLITTIAGGIGPLRFAETMANGQVYVNSDSTSTIAVIDPSTNSILRTITACDGSVNALISMRKDPSNPGQYYTSCKSPSLTINAINIADDTLLNSFPVDNEGLAIAVSPSGKEVAAPRLGSGFLDIYDTSTGALTHSVSTTAVGYMAQYSPDSRKIYLATPGGFDTNNLDVVDTSSWTVTSVPTPNLALSLLSFIPPEDSIATSSINFTVTSPVSSSSNNLADTGESQTPYLILSLSIVVLSAFLIASKYKLVKDKLLKNG